VRYIVQLCLSHHLRTFSVKKSCLKFSARTLPLLRTFYNFREQPCRHLTMPDIFYTFPIDAPVNKVFAGIATPEGLDAWWTKTSSGIPQIGEVYTLYFGPEYLWKAIVTKHQHNEVFELELTDAMPIWMGTKVGFTLTAKGSGTETAFYHTGWIGNTEHYRTSGFCWAMYLRILKRWLEHGETVAYEHRLNS
jgi:uncharacterized protein YndB with AHSA1/START domain